MMKKNSFIFWVTNFFLFRKKHLVVRNNSFKVPALLKHHSPQENGKAVKDPNNTNKNI